MHSYSALVKWERGDAIFTDRLTAAHAKRDIIRWSVDEPDVPIGCEEAWIAYVNRGSIKHAESLTAAVSWLESANLGKVDGAWKLVFFHSARAPAPIPPQ